MTGGKKIYLNSEICKPFEGTGLSACANCHRKSDCVGLRASGSEWSLVKHARLLEEEEHSKPLVRPPRTLPHLREL